MKSLRRIDPLKAVVGCLLLTACSTDFNHNKSSTTGWKYNDAKWGGFEAVAVQEQITGPGLVFIEGGTFTMGSQEQDVTYDQNNVERRVTVPSFYMDEHEVTNRDYLEYLHWMSRIFGTDLPDVYRRSVPDTLVWRAKLENNEHYVKYYFRHPAYAYYPVVGVSWLQSTEYCKWRTDRVNESILLQEGLISKTSLVDQANEKNFNTDAYLEDQYVEGDNEKGLIRTPSGEKRRARMEDGILLPDYRLPTEAEWEYAAYALIGNSMAENTNTRRTYPWNGLTVRQSSPESQRGIMQANFKRGRGDNAGLAGSLNDGGFITMKVKSFPPNDFGLYDMAGNVSEWVLDVYRPLSFEDVSDFNSFRGNVYETKILDDENKAVEKDSLGRIQMRKVTEAENINRLNYKKSDNIGAKDELTYETQDQAYNKDYDEANPKSVYSTAVTNTARVFKGGSWEDRAYWLSPGTRRFLEQNQSTRNIGFRCAMHRVGAAVQGQK